MSKENEEQIKEVKLSIGTFTEVAELVPEGFQDGQIMIEGGGGKTRTVKAVSLYSAANGAKRVILHTEMLGT